ncbi:DUF1819 family protein [Pelotomaculum terephthalicicum JT]|uniref:DUF1819 family protein n=1 Tax=Pelotomaculum terephthalicicum TaxID=206393 RepID=UPI001F045AF3|nr:DUF1819 family protein [Pelotomaculum terephthalicicum]MCG9969220.1 DUF1819 family protein [Pelotomaculum terephthalicicum JT]
MGLELPYTSSIKDMPFMFSDMRRTAQLLCEGKTREEIIELSMTANIYQLEKEKRRRDLPLRMLKRLGTLDMPLVSIVANGRDEDAKLIAFLALIKSDRLFFEFMREIYSDKFLSGQTEIDDKEFLTFIERKAQNDDTVAGWTPNNLVRIRNTYKNILCEAGLAKKDKDALIILKPVCNRKIPALLKGENAPYAKAMLLEV